MIRVVVVDDHEIVRSGISRLLSDAKGIEVLAQLASGEEAYQFVREHNPAPDVILMDVRMPGIGGIEATRKIVRHNPDIRVVALTAVDDAQYPQWLLKAGARGYITKGNDPEDMINAILKVHSGQRYISPDLAQKLALRPFDEHQHSPFDELSERELQIATMIVGCQKVSDISERLFLSPKTVNTYRYRLFEKLGIESDVELTLLAVRHGLVDPEAR